jgi:hypothetical protein
MKLAIPPFACLDEGFTSLGAKRALCGAHLHGGIVAKPLALRRAQLARFGTGAAHLNLKWATARHHLRCDGTEVGAVAASFGGCYMVGMAVPEHLQAIGGTVIARALAIGASPRDLQHSDASAGIAETGIAETVIAETASAKTGLATAGIAGARIWLSSSVLG